MPQVYTLRAPENFNHHNNHHLTIGKIDDNAKDHHRRIPSASLRSDDDIQHSSLLTHQNFNPRVTTAAVKKKRKSPILHRDKTQTSYLDSRDRTTPEYNEQSSSSKSQDFSKSSRKRVTIYTITSSDDNPFPSQMSRTLSPSISQHHKKSIVSFDRINYYDQSDTLEESYYPSMGVSYIPLAQSKAMESIERSMNLYRFRRY